MDGNCEDGKLSMRASLDCDRLSIWLSFGSSALSSSLSPVDDPLLLSSSSSRFSSSSRRRICSSKSSSGVFLVGTGSPFVLLVVIDLFLIISAAVNGRSLSAWLDGSCLGSVELQEEEEESSSSLEEDEEEEEEELLLLELDELLLLLLELVSALAIVCKSSVVVLIISGNCKIVF